MCWSNTDPREYFDKYGNIVVFCRHTGKVFTGDVSVKEQWIVFLRGRNLVDENSFIGANDEWPTHWDWILAPDLRRSNNNG